MFSLRFRVASSAIFCLCVSHASAAATIDAATQQRVVRTLIDKLAAHYVSPAQAERTGAILRQKLERGDFAQLTDPEAFANRLHQELDQSTADSHFGVYYMPKAVPSDAEPPYVAPMSAANAKQSIAYFTKAITEGSAENFGFEKSERRPGNVAYLKIASFYNPALATTAVTSTMSRLTDAAALVIDLRGNGGGSPQTAALVSAYLFDDKPVHLSDSVTRGWNRRESSWTLPPPSDHRYGSKKPVFIVIDKDTYSAAEYFAYTLQALKRATIVGEPSKGGAHGSRSFKLDADFLVMIPNRLTMSSVTGKDWDKTGVLPDVEATPDNALDRAMALATAAAKAK